LFVLSLTGVAFRFSLLKPPTAAIEKILIFQPISLTDSRNEFSVILCSFGHRDFHYQLTLGGSKMKSEIFWQIVLAISVVEGFVQFPFLAKNLASDFLSKLQDDHTISLDGVVSGEKCNRECKPNDVKICRFHFMMKYFQVLGG
jgi:hypothetical protein